jgi:hypothetical protein
MLFLSMLVSCASRPALPTVVPVEPDMPLDRRAVRSIAVRSCPTPRPTSEAVELAQCPGPAELDAMLARTGDAWQWEDETYDDGEERVTGFVVKGGQRPGHGLDRGARAAEPDLPPARGVRGAVIDAGSASSIGQDVTGT